MKINKIYKIFIYIIIFLIIISLLYFISIKKENLSNEVDIKFAIVIATFNRSNGKTIPYLTRSIESIIQQEYTNWDIILVGDKFKPEHIVLDFIDEYKNKTNNKIIYLQNLKPERDYIHDKSKLWNCAGATSINLGLKYARNNNYKYYCHLDDDDYWTPNHLTFLYNVYSSYPNCIFANTKSTYVGSYLPEEKIEIYENNKLPTGGGMIHSAISFRIDIIPYYYDTAFNENDILGASDFLMLEKIKKYILENKKYSSVYISELTCYHDIEGELK